MTEKDEIIQRQARDIRELKKKLKEAETRAENAAKEAQEAASALLGEIAIQYGNPVFDDVPGIPEYPRPIGYRLDVRAPKPGRTYAVTVDRAEMCIIGVESDGKI